MTSLDRESIDHASLDPAPLVRDPESLDLGPEVDLDAPVAPPHPSTIPPRRLGALAGLLAGAAAVGVGLLAAQVMETVSPTDAVGSEFIDNTPKWLRDLAIDWFGTNDKRALRVGMFVVMAALAALIGVRSMRTRWVGIAGFLGFGVVGAYVVLGRPGVPDKAALAPLIGGVVGACCVTLLVTTLVGRWRARRTPHRSRAPLGMDRRRFVATSGAVAAVAAVTTGTAVALERRRVNRIEASRPDTLPPVASTAPSTTTAPTSVAPSLAPGEPFNPLTTYLTPNKDFYRIDTALSFPNISTGSWSVQIHGMVDSEITLSYADLLARPQVERTITLCCVSNEVGGRLVGNATWQGVLLKDLLDEAGVQSEAEQVFSTSIDGWTSGFPVGIALDGRDAMVAIGMNGEPLPVEHGFPARLVIPGLYGYVSATKWLKSIRLTKWDGVDGYWIPRGWSKEGPIKTQSRIDVPKGGQKVFAGTVVIAGVAWAQHRGIDKVEVQIDDGAWQEALLGEENLDDAWRLWRLVWDATEGGHTMKVRATDKTGETQTDVRTDIAPNGATGYHTRKVKVRPPE